MIIAILLFVLILVLVVFFYQKFGKLAVYYDLSDDRFRVFLFRLVPVFSVKISEISNVRKISFSETFGLGFFTLRLGSKMFGEMVLIEKRKGFFRSALITPDNAESFVAEIKNQKNFHAST